MPKTETTLWQKIKWFFGVIFEPMPPTNKQIWEEWERRYYGED